MAFRRSSVRLRSAPLASGGPALVILRQRFAGLLDTLAGSDVESIQGVTFTKNP